MVCTGLGCANQRSWDYRRAWGHSKPTSEVQGQHRVAPAVISAPRGGPQQVPALPTDVLRLSSVSPSHVVYVLFKLLLLYYVPGRVWV